MTEKFSEAELADRTPVAKEVFTHCTKEKIDTWHIVMNHDAKGYVNRVQCKACKSEHKYKKLSTPAKPVKAAAVRKVVSPSERAKVMNQGTFEQDWFAAIKKWGDKQVSDYDPKRHYILKEVLLHEVFGKGVVKGRRENKIDVLFQNGLKVLPSPSKAI
jgi:hypothetical protein